MVNSDLWSGCLFTGLRLGELLALTAADVGEDHVTVRHSKTGKSRRVPLNAEGTEFFRALVNGKSPNAKLRFRCQFAARQDEYFKGNGPDVRDCEN